MVSYERLYAVTLGSRRSAIDGYVNDDVEEGIRKAQELLPVEKFSANTQT